MCSKVELRHRCRTRRFSLQTKLIVLTTLFGLASRSVESQTMSSAVSSCHVETTAPVAPKVASSLQEGYGTGGFGIKSNSQQAQAYFNNGMQLAHAFAHQSAAAAFRKAEQLDPSCAMCIWGEAWSRGPSINFTINAEAQAQLLKLVLEAKSLATENPLLERQLIAALMLRYQNGGGNGKGDIAYAQAMDQIAKDNPESDEITVMTADAWLIPASQANTRNHLDRAIQLLEDGLEKHPNNTALIHFYMHATEMDGVAAEALPYAERLATLAPAASHLVHMPSHVYFIMGRYKDAEQSNLSAVAIDEANAARIKPPGGVFALGYHDHNVLYGEEAALISNDSEGGLRLASSELTELATMKPEQTFKQFGLGTALVILGRFGSPPQVNALAEPGPSLPFAEAMWHYGRGEFAARNHTASDLLKESEAIHLSEKDSANFQSSYPQASAMVNIAKLVLMGRLAMLEGHWSIAEAAYRNAAEIQEAKLGTITDPPAWWYPIRRSVGAAMLAKGNAQAAIIEEQQALAFWPKDPLSLNVLAACYEKLGDKAGGERLPEAVDGPL
jgi:tetratricopeptide (TPR) repeat protein